MKEAGQKAGEKIVSIVDGLPTFAEAIAAAAVKDGVQGVRGRLKEIARDLRAAIADAMEMLASEAEPSMIEPDESEPA